MPRPDVEFVASKLMQAWFSKNHKDESWLNSEDGKQWVEISILDATVAVNAYEEFYGDDLK